MRKTNKQDQLEKSKQILSLRYIFGDRICESIFHFAAVVPSVVLLNVILFSGIMNKLILYYYKMNGANVEP